MTKYRILSDIHLEWCPANHIKQGDEDAVILAGDIRPGGCLKWARKVFPDKRIFYVPGNHEYYGQEFHSLNDKLRKQAWHAGIDFLLYGEMYKTIGDDTVIIGGTLWTDFKLFDPTIPAPLAKKYIWSAMNDYEFIKFDGGKLQPSDTETAHLKTRSNILKILQGLSGKENIKKVIIVTHHLPSIKSSLDKYLKDPTTAAYASNLEYIIANNPIIKAWVHGHCHNSNDYMLGDCRVISNPRGYAKVAMKLKDGSEVYNEENFSFNPNLTIEV